MLTEEFKTAFARYVKEFEGEKLRIYDDGFGVPTIGNGFALINKVKDIWEPYPDDELKKKGLNLTNKQFDIIQEYANLKTQGKSTSKLKSQLKQFKDIISVEISENLLMNSIQEKYNQIKNQIGEENWDKLNFAQQIGVMDHCFQRGNVLKLKKSLIAGDYKKTSEIMRNINPALKARADLRADFVEYGVMEFPGIYIVKPGDTLAKISKMSCLSVHELRKINPNLWDSDILSIGQKIKITYAEVIPKVTIDAKGNRIFQFEIVHRNEQNNHTIFNTREISFGPFFARLSTNNLITNVAQLPENFDESSCDQIYKMLYSQETENSNFGKILNLTETQYNNVFKYLASGIKYGHVKELQQESTTNQGEIIEDYYVVKEDDNISLIQDLYHATGLPLYFTVVYTKAELNSLQSEDAKKALEKYSCRDEIKQKLHSIYAESKEQLSFALNIDPKMVETTSNFWSCFSSRNTELRVKVDEVFLDTITSLIVAIGVPEYQTIHSQSVDKSYMTKALNDIFLSYKLPPSIEKCGKVRNYEVNNDDNLKFEKLNTLIEKELMKSKKKLEMLLMEYNDQSVPTDSNLTKEELIRLYENKIEELQQKFKENWKKFENNPRGYMYQPGDKLPGSATFNEEQHKISIWLSEQLSKISDEPSSKSGSNKNNLQIKEKIIEGWNSEIEKLRKKPEFNDNLEESMNNIDRTISTISQVMTQFFEKKMLNTKIC